MRRLVRRLLRPWRNHTSHVVFQQKLAAHEEVADAFQHRLRHLERERQLYEHRRDIQET